MLLVFSHANSFPASTYKVLFKSLRSRGFAVKAIDKYGHDPQYPVSNNWPHLVQHLADFAGHEVEKAAEPAYLVGHSLGGFLSLMAAARHPVLGGHPVAGVLLLDTPLLGGWRAGALGMIKRTKLVGAVSPAKVSRSRRNSWPSQDAALEHFKSKKAFARWDPQVLQDYIAHGMHMADGKCLLGFEREIETAIYNTLPHNLDRMIKRHPLKCPVAFIGGRQSAEMKQVGMAMTEKLTMGRVSMLEGSHLFPMEKPLATAAAIEAALRDMQP